MNAKHNEVDRRGFLKAVGAAGLGSVLALTETGAAVDNTVSVPKRKLGKTGLEVSSLSLGTIFDTVENQVILKKCYQWGVTFWDTAPDYSGPNSELGIGKFIAEDPKARKNLFIATKASDATSVADVEKRLHESLKRLNTDYIDLYYVMDFVEGDKYYGHGLSDPAVLTDELKQWAGSARKRGLIRAFGFTTHKNMPKCLNAAAKLGWIDAVMPVYNYRFLDNAEMQAAVEACHKAGIGLVAMKTQAKWPKGAETKLTEKFTKRGFTQGQAKIKLVLEDKRFCSACVRMESVALVASNAAAVLDKTKLSQTDKQVFKRYAQQIPNGYCTGCAEICDSALPGMPYVSDIMRYLMYYNSYGDRDRAKELFARIPAGARNKLAVTNYSRAQARCPQHLPIGKLVAEAVSKLA